MSPVIENSLKTRHQSGSSANIRLHHVTSQRKSVISHKNMRHFRITFIVNIRELAIFWQPKRVVPQKPFQFR